VTQPFAATAPSFMYLETTIPAGITIPEYRRSRPQRRRGLKRLRRAGVALAR
jgi:hypothetical protein